MNTVTLHFKADNQQLTALDGLYKLASNTVEYVKAIFTLGENWTGFDVVRAAWYTDFECISTVLDGNGECFVPWEVLSRPEGVTINLYGCDLEEESDGDAVLVDRLTTYPVKAILVDVDARVCGSETKPVTPSQFEQYIAIVQELVGTVRDITSCVLNPDYTLTINYSDDTSDTVGPIRGEQGEQGPPGPAGNGISKIEKISTAGLVDTYRITFTNGTHKDYTVTNGAKGDTGNGIESIYLTGTSGAVKTYTILFTNGDTFEYQVTDGEVTLAQFEKAFPTDTASGSIASFPDGSDLFDYLSCVVNIEPVQDLHGYDKPWVGGAGVNKFDATKQTIMDANKVTLNGETFTMTWTDGSIMITGKGVQTFPAGTYYFSATGTGDMNNVLFGVYNASTNTSMRTQAPGFSFTASDEFYLIIYGLYSAPGTATFKVQIEQGSTGTIWKPFANICPITGWTGCEVVVSGVNLFDFRTFADEFPSLCTYDSTTGVLAVTPNVPLYTDGVPVHIPLDECGGGFLTAMVENGNNRNVRVKFFFSDGTTTTSTLSGTGTGYVEITKVIPAKVITAIGIDFSTFDAFNIKEFSITKTTVDTDYTAYNGHTYTASLGQTVYGGHIDFVSGVLTVTHAKVSSADVTYGVYDGGTHRISVVLPTAMPEHSVLSSSSTVANMYCSNLKVTSKNGVTSGYGNISYSDTSNLRMFIARVSENVSTVNEMQTWASNNPFDIVYELNTPQTYQLTPTQIHALLGQNNVWADCGDTSVTYKADVQRWVEKKLGA